MKKIFFALASFALISSANAADGSDIKFNAELWFKYFSNSQQDFTKSGAENFWTQRTKMGAHWSKGDDLGAQVTLLNGVVWGNNTPNNLVGNTAAGGLGYVGQGIDVYEAWAFWKAMDNLVVKVGRGAMDIADGTVVSKNDELLHPFAFDGVMAAYYTEFASFNFFGVKGGDASNYNQNLGGALNNYGGINSAEANFYGLSVDVRNLPEALKMVNVHVMEQKGSSLTDPTATSTALSDSKTRYGVTLKGDYMHLDYRGTYAGYTGKDKAGAASQNEKGTMYDVEGGYTFADMMNWRVAANYHSDSGSDSVADDRSAAGTTVDNKHYDPFFYNEDLAGLMHAVQWGNLTYWKLGTSLEPMESVKVSFDYYSFTKTQAKDDVALGWGNGATAAAGVDKKVGTEWDLAVNKRLSNGVTAGAYYSMFTPTKNTNYTNTDPKAFSQIGLDARFTF